jgi:gamma-glutamyltranspeptidase
VGRALEESNGPSKPGVSRGLCNGVERPRAFAVDAFGGGQAIAVLENAVLAGASDRRKDGCALGLY